MTSFSKMLSSTYVHPTFVLMRSSQKTSLIWRNKQIKLKRRLKMTLIEAVGEDVGNEC